MDFTGSDFKGPQQRSGQDRRYERGRRSGIDRRKFNDPNYKGPECRSGRDRRSGKDRRLELDRRKS